MQRLHLGLGKDRGGLRVGGQPQMGREVVGSYLAPTLSIPRWDLWPAAPCPQAHHWASSTEELRLSPREMPNYSAGGCARARCTGERAGVGERGLLVATGFWERDAAFCPGLVGSEGCTRGTLHPRGDRDSKARAPAGGLAPPTQAAVNPGLAATTRGKSFKK